MSLRTSKAVILLRNFGRMIGLNKIVGGLLARGDYEERYDQELAEQLQAGDIVWDIGANIGFYTNKFSQLVGAEGRVVGFEPSPLNFEKLQSNCSEAKNISLLNIGLGSEDAEFRFCQGKDDIGATSRVVSAGEEADTTVVVKSANSILVQGLAPQPQIIKIDVEGFELDVMHGMENILSNVDVRAIGIEIHFGILKQKNLSEAPKKIETMLKSNGFSVQWIGVGHILARRIKRK